LARAVVPVAGGILFFVALFGLTWLFASWASRNPENVSNLGDRTFQVGTVQRVSEQIADDGPILFPDLRDPDGSRAIVLDHTGDDPTLGWRVFYVYPADRDPTCLARQVQSSRTFVDCDGRELDIEQLTRPADVRPIVENQRMLYIDLRTPASPTGEG
jgi:hypothetical protein